MPDSVYTYLRADRAHCCEIAFTADADYDGGDLVEIGNTLGVVYDPVATGEEGLALIEVPSGGVLVPAGSAAFSAGDVVYYSTSASNVNDNDANPAVGRALAPAASGDDRVLIKLTNEAPLA